MLEDVQERLDRFQERIQNGVEWFFGLREEGSFMQYGHGEYLEECIDYLSGEMSLERSRQMNIQVAGIDQEALAIILDQVSGVPEGEYAVVSQIHDLTNNYIAAFRLVLGNYRHVEKHSRQSTLVERVRNRNLAAAQEELLATSRERVTLETLPRLIAHVTEIGEDYLFEATKPEPRINYPSRAFYISK